MKTFLLPSRAVLMLITALLPVILFCSCKNEYDPDIIWDMNPVAANIHVQNIYKQNLLEPSARGSLYGKKITAEYNGQEYELNWDGEEGSRVVLAIFEGLTLKYGYRYTEETGMIEYPYISFGDFAGENNHDITLKLRIEGYDTAWTINVTHKIKWKGNKPDVTNKYTLNGKEVNKIVITL